MVTETARVVALENEFAWVETQRKAVCHSCSARNGCGTGLLSRLLSNRAQPRIKVLNTIGARVGDAVEVGLEEGTLLRTSLAVYAMPLVLMMAGALGGELLGEGLQLAQADGFSALSGLGGLAGGFWWLRRYSAILARDGRHQANLVGFAHTAPVAVPMPRRP